jgi:hypothetical protein
MSLVSISMSGSSDPAQDDLARRFLALKRAFQRELRHRPTFLQKTLMNAAAMAMAKAELAATDVSITPNDYVRLSNHARQARAEMFAAFQNKRLDDSAALDQYLDEAAT